MLGSRLVRRRGERYVADPADAPRMLRAEMAASIQRMRASNAAGGEEHEAGRQAADIAGGLPLPLTLSGLLHRLPKMSG